jgi:hypothetical protein
MVILGINTGVLKETSAEIIPFEPDPDNTGDRENDASHRCRSKALTHIPPIK